jgi:hypothetical protein
MIRVKRIAHYVTTESTIHKLFDAQRQHPDASPVLSREQLPSHNHYTAQKSTLHSFWRLPKPPNHAPLAPVQPPTFNSQETTQCEDCERALQSTDSMDIDMMAVDIADECACQSCGRRVCDMCAVSMDGRRCLTCASLERS